MSESQQVRDELDGLRRILRPPSNTGSEFISEQENRRKSYEIPMVLWWRYSVLSSIIHALVKGHELMRVFTGPKAARARSESARERRLRRDEDLGAEKAPPGEGEAGRQ